MPVWKPCDSDGRWKFRVLKSANLDEEICDPERSKNELRAPKAYLGVSYQRTFPVTLNHFQ